MENFSSLFDRGGRCEQGPEDWEQGPGNNLPPRSQELVFLRYDESA